MREQQGEDLGPEDAGLLVAAGRHERVVHRLRGVVAEDDDGPARGLLEQVAQPRELGGVERPVGVAVGVDGVQGDEPDPSLVEGVVRRPVGAVAGR